MGKLATVSITALALAVSASASASTWPERSAFIFGHDRANEDWTYVDQLEETDKSFAERLKRMPVSENGDWKVSLSANLKVAFDNRWNHMFNQQDRKHNQLRSRLYLGSEVAYQDWMRIYGEMRVNYTNIDDHGPIDAGGTDIHQLFAQFNLLDREDQNLSTRIGRQEIYLSELQLMNREPTPVQASWDAVTAQYSIGNANFDLYWGEEIFPHRSDAGWGGNFRRPHERQQINRYLLQLEYLIWYPACLPDGQHPEELFLCERQPWSCRDPVLGYRQQQPLRQWCGILL